MSNKDMMGNWMAAMGMMGTMMAQFQQQASKSSQPPPPPEPVQLGANYGYGGGGGYSQSNSNYGYGGHDPAPPPPPPPLEDAPMPPEYSYPRFLEPNVAADREKAESHGWRRKTDADLEPEKQEPKISAAQQALITAAERAAKITGKVTGIKAKPAYDSNNVPDMKAVENRPYPTLAIAAGNYSGQSSSDGGGITNVSFASQKEHRRATVLNQQFLGIGAFGNQQASIRGDPMKWNKRTKKYVEDKIDWKMTHKYRELARPLEGSITMAPERGPQIVPKPKVEVELVANINGKMCEMATNNPQRVPGLHGVCEDPNLADEDEVLDVKLKPTNHFYYGKNWEDCVNGVKRESLSGRRPWERGYNTPPEANKQYVEKYRIRVAREKALKLLDDISEANEAKKPSQDPVIGFITNEVEGRIAKSAMVPPPVKNEKQLGYHSQATINRTDVLTWTSQKGHTNQVSQKDGSQTDDNVAIAGNRLKTGQQGKRAAPLAWNFVKEGVDAVHAKNPKIGPKDPKLVTPPPTVTGEKARYIPDDLNPSAALELVNTITSQKCDICSKSFQNNASSRTSHYQSNGHLKKLNNWLKQKGYPLIQLSK